MANFSKYQGTGNDFIMIDNRDGSFMLSNAQVEKLCNRRFGIGADGLILIENVEGYDFKMVYYNSDGNTSTMCGNGGRCLVKFAQDLGIFESKTTFLAIDGPHHASVNAEIINLGMIDVTEINKVEQDYFLNTGSPHLIVFKDELKDLNIKEIGASIRYSEYWKAKGGVNVNFVKIINKDTIEIRTYERGVEDETFSCGTGVTAAAIASYYAGLINSNNVKVKAIGGDLSVKFYNIEKQSFTNVVLSGAALKVFSGQY